MTPKDENYSSEKPDTPNFDDFSHNVERLASETVTQRIDRMARTDQQAMRYLLFGGFEAEAHPPVAQAVMRTGN